MGLFAAEHRGGQALRRWWESVHLRGKKEFLFGHGLVCLMLMGTDG
jgi:hypothetical protein